MTTPFFSCAFYMGCAAVDVPYGHADKTWRFWMPLLQLFMGMRPKEICQMYVGDLRRTQKGTTFIDIAATDDDDEKTPGELKKTTKTKGAGGKFRSTRS